MQTWNCIWELAEVGKIKEKVKYRGTHPCFRDCCKNPSDENRATAKIPKKSCKPRKCECTPHIWEQRRWMTTSKEWWCDIFLAKQWFWRGFQDFRKWQFEQFHFLILSNLRPYLLSSVVFRLKFLDAQTLRKSRRTTWKIQDLKTKMQIYCFRPNVKFRGHDLKALAGGCWQIVLICFKLTAVVQLRRLARLVAFVGGQ